jgi:hypothetical protein
VCTTGDLSAGHRLQCECRTFVRVLLQTVKHCSDIRSRNRSVPENCVKWRRVSFLPFPGRQNSCLTSGPTRYGKAHWRTCRPRLQAVVSVCWRWKREICEDIDLKKTQGRAYRTCIDTSPCNDFDIALMGLKSFPGNISSGTRCCPNPSRSCGYTLSFTLDLGFEGNFWTREACSIGLCSVGNPPTSLSIHHCLCRARHSTTSQERAPLTSVVRTVGNLQMGGI